jgi:hypothetical protein
MKKAFAALAVLIIAGASFFLTGCPDGLPPDEGLIRWDSADKPPLSTGSALVQAQVARVRQASINSGFAWLPVDDGIPRFYPAADTYVQVGSSQNHGGDAEIEYKGVNDTSTRRIAFLRFDLTAFPASSAGGAYLELTNTALQDYIKTTAAAYEVTDNTWDEMALIWANKPAVETAVLGSAYVSATGVKITIDLTAFVNDRLSSGQKIFSIALQDPENKAARTRFSSREGLNPPVLLMIGPGEAAGSGEAPDTDSRNEAKIGRASCR